MPYAPLISKIRCHNPNKIRSRVANRNYLSYIATREGVDISKVNDINDLLNNDEMMEKDLDDDIVYNEADNDNYVKYMAKRPRSHGLFGNINTDDLDKIASHVSKLTKEGKNIYRGIISLSEKDAEALGFVNKDKWNLYLKKVMPDIAKELGVSISNFTWVAAFHAEKTHPHVHYELWDNTNKIKSSFIHTSVQHKCRELLSNTIFDDDYEAMIKDILKLERDELNEIRNRSRESITNTVKDLMNETAQFIPGLNLEKLPSRITTEEVMNLSEHLSGLVDMLPTKGSADYAYLSKDLKSYVDSISDTLFERSDLKKELHDYLKAVGDGQKLLGQTKYNIKIVEDNAMKDIYKRIGNIIIKKAKFLKKYGNQFDITNEKQEYINMHPSSTKENNIMNSNILIDKELNEATSVLDMSFEYKERGEVFSNKYFSANHEFCLDWNTTYNKALIYLYDPKEQDFDKAFKLLKEEANQNNNVLAYHELGKMYEAGKGTEVNKEMSNNYYKLAYNGYLKLSLDSVDGNLMYRIGKMLYNGIGTEKNENLAVEYLEKSASLNNENAQIALAKIYMKTGEYKKVEAAMNILNKLSSNNNMAQYILGKLYLDGNIMNKDLNRAIDLLTKSANQGNQYAQYQLGKLYLRGNHIEKNEEKGLYWLNKAVSQGNEYAVKLMENYNNYKNDVIPSIAFGIIKSSYNILNSQTQKTQFLNNDRIYRSKSKQAKKEAALKKQVPGTDPNIY